MVKLSQYDYEFDNKTGGPNGNASKGHALTNPDPEPKALQLTTQNPPIRDSEPKTRNPESRTRSEGSRVGGFSLLPTLLPGTPNPSVFAS